MAGYVDELQKVLKENSTKGVWHGVGEGTPDRGNFRLKQGKLESFDPELEKPPVVNAPMIITDEMDPIEYLGSDKREMFTSMSRYKRRVKEDGYEITGGDHITGKIPSPKKASIREIREEVEKAYHDIKNDRIEFSEREKQIHIEEERKSNAYKERNNL